MTKVKSVERPHEIINGINVKKSNAPIKKTFEDCLYKELICKRVNIKTIK